MDVGKVYWVKTQHKDWILVEIMDHSENRYHARLVETQKSTIVLREDQIISKQEQLDILKENV